MSTSSPKRNAIRKEAIALLWKEQKSKNEAYNFLIKKYLNHEKVLEVLTYLPDKSRKEQYKRQEYFLIALFVSLFIYSLNDTVFGGSIMLALLIYSLVTHRVGIYIYIAVYGILMSLIGIFMIVYNGAEISASQALFILVPILTAIYTIWLEKKLCPRPTVSKETYHDTNRKKKFKIKVDFPD